MDGFSDDYLSVAAHDLRGSLNSIIGWAELIKRRALPEDGIVRAGETIIRQAKALRAKYLQGNFWPACGTTGGVLLFFLAAVIVPA